VLKALRAPRNRPYLHVLVYVLLVSVVSVLVFSTCAMPAPWRTASSDAMPAGCSESAEPAAVHTRAPVQDCSFKPCLDSQPNLASHYKLDKPELPILLVGLVWLIGRLLPGARAPLIPRVTSPPKSRRIPLIYRFCTLLN